MSVATRPRESIYGRAPAAQGFERPGFWSKRKKTATSLIATIGLLAGIAIAYKLFDQTVPNNVVRDASNFDFEVWKMEGAAGDTDFVQAGSTMPIFRYSAALADAVSMYPGDTRTVDVKLINTNVAPAKDASFSVYIQNIEVHDRSDPAALVTIASTDPRWSRFVSFFTIKVDKQNILNSSLTGDISNDYPIAGVQYTETCSGGLREITKNSPCNLGLVRSAGSESFFGDATDERLYKFKMNEADDGTDQSAFKGWAVKFELVFSARLPAVPEDEFPIGER